MSGIDEMAAHAELCDARDCCETARRRVVQLADELRDAHLAFGAAELRVAVAAAIVKQVQVNEPEVVVAKLVDPRHRYTAVQEAEPDMLELEAGDDTDVTDVDAEVED
jgi:hypothetical protein